MSEIKYLIDGKEVKYEGLFDLRGLFKAIDDFFRERGYDRLETKNYEEVYETGRQITIELLPYKKVNDYVKMQIRIYAFFKEVRDKVVEIDGVKRKLQHGKAEFWFDADLLTDYEHRWESRVVLYFLRTISDKFIRKSQVGMAEEICKKDCMDVIELVKNFLNMNRHSFAPASGSYFIGS